MGRKGKSSTEDPQDEGGATEVPESTKPKVLDEEEKSGAQTEGKYFLNVVCLLKLRKQS
jgi:hypothetical protein